MNYRFFKDPNGLGTIIYNCNTKEITAIAYNQKASDGSLIIAGIVIDNLPDYNIVDLEKESKELTANDVRVELSNLVNAVQRFNQKMLEEIFNHKPQS